MNPCNCRECFEYREGVRRGDFAADDVAAFFAEIDEGIMAHAAVKLSPEKTARVLILLKEKFFSGAMAAPQ